MSSATKFPNANKAGFNKFWVAEYSVALPVLADGERAIAQADLEGRLLTQGKRHRTIVVVPAVSVSPAYSLNDHIGAKMVIANALRPGSLSGRLMSLTVNCKTVQTNTLAMAIFKSDPTGTTITDNAAANIAAADFDKLVGIYTLGAGSSKMGTHTTFNLDNINKAIQAAQTTLWAALINTVGTPTLGSVSDISAEFGIEQD